MQSLVLITWIIPKLRWSLWKLISDNLFIIYKKQAISLIDRDRFGSSVKIQIYLCIHHFPQCVAFVTGPSNSYRRSRQLYGNQWAIRIVSIISKVFGANGTITWDNLASRWLCRVVKICWQPATLPASLRFLPSKSVNQLQ